MFQLPYTLYHGNPAPIVPVEIKGADGWKRLQAYVDSGAAYSIFGIAEAQWLGLDFHKGMLITAIVGDGNHIPVHLLKVPVRLGTVEFEATIGFSEKLGVGFNLIGRKDFFEQFRICFSDKERVITFYSTV